MSCSERAGSDDNVVVNLLGVPLNWRLAPQEWAYIIDNAEAGLVFAEAGFCSAIDSIRADIPALSHSIVIGSQDPGTGWTAFDALLEGCQGIPEGRLFIFQFLDCLFELRECLLEIELGGFCHVIIT